MDILHYFKRKKKNSEEENAVLSSSTEDCPVPIAGCSNVSEESETNERPEKRQKTKDDEDFAITGVGEYLLKIVLFRKNK